MSANATVERPAPDSMELGEPTLKMLRYQQQFLVLRHVEVNNVIQFANLTDEALTNDLGKVLEAIAARIAATSPRIVIVDSFRTLLPRAAAQGSMELQEFVQRLAMHLTLWQATTFLLGEYPEPQIRDNPVFTMADGLLTMNQHVNRNSMVRQIQVLKMRGNAPQPGLHTIRISDRGVQAFPRMLKPIEEAQAKVTKELISTGIPGLDDMLAGERSVAMRSWSPARSAPARAPWPAVHRRGRGA